MDSATLHNRLALMATSHIWTWDPELRRFLDRHLSPPTSGIDGAHPARTVAAIDEGGLARMAADSSFTSDLQEQWDTVSSYLKSSSGDPDVAYFSPEFGISARVPQYSGGLGILAGDHLKAASDLDLPLVGVGLFYRQGFFRQELADGGQSERYETHEPAMLGAHDTGVLIEVPMADRNVTAKVWRMTVGRISMILLDTDLETNGSEDRAITDRLYSGDRRHRLEQEMILGIGGARALAALDLNPPVYHLNEGHAGFLIFELIDRELANGGDLGEALDRIEHRLLFTTHTPVPAGIDRFARHLIDPYLEPWAERWQVEVDEIADLGFDVTGEKPEFNMAVLCLRTAGKANGVSRLHGTVSRDLFGHVAKGRAIESITNGVHARTWTPAHIQEAFDEVAGPTWADGEPEAWERIGDLSGSAVVNLRRRGAEILSKMVAERTGITLDPETPTIGFARRFATYKRADLLLRHRELLEELLADDKTPVQFVFAGKAHPADDDGKELLANIVDFAAGAAARSRFIFVADYDIAVAQAMYAGCDVWLNNPVRPREASGTSGEKAALNGSLNCSISDGWWDEMATKEIGWTIPASDATDAVRRDLDESSAALKIISDQILPAYWADGRPWSEPWINRIRASWRTLGPQVTAARMVADYRDKYYHPLIDAAAAR